MGAFGFYRFWELTFACLFVFLFAATQVIIIVHNDSKEYLRVYMNSFDEKTLNLDDLNEQTPPPFRKKLNGARVTFMDAQGNVLARQYSEDD